MTAAGRISWRALALCAAFAFFSLLAPGCKELQDCRPGTLFVKLKFPATGTAPNRLTVSVAVDGGTLTAEVPYASGETLEIELPEDRYVEGAAVTVTVVALADQTELARASKPVTLPASCGTLELDLGDSSDLGVPDGEAPGDGPPASSDMGKKANGATCTKAEECVSNLCVDGYCCNAACTDQCEACDVAGSEGTCAVVPSGAPHGSRTPCAGAGTTCGGACGGVVRTACAYPGPQTSCRAQSCSGGIKTKAAGCDGAGACPAPETVTCPQVCAGDECLGACTSDTQCTDASKPFCDDGTCTPKKPLGRLCSAGSECTSGHCADDRCCNTACTAQCESCNQAGAEGTCLKRTGAPLTGSNPSRTACAGTGPCQGQCDGVSPTCVMPGASKQCGMQTCVGGTLTPVGGCNGMGACNQTPMICPNGACNSAGTDCGPCTNDSQCGTGRYCSGGMCQNKKSNGTACAASNECTSGICIANSSGTAICCGTSCSGTTPRCAASGSGCVCSGSSCGSGKVCLSSGTCCTPICPPCRTSNNDGCGGTCTNPGLCSTKCCGTKCCASTSQTCCTDGNCYTLPPANCSG